MKGVLFILMLAAACMTDVSHGNTVNSITPAEIHDFVEDTILDLFRKNPGYYSDGFDFPVGKPDGKGYYNAQGFQKNNHLGDDWNGNKGGNTDFGDTIYAVSNGYISQSVQFFGGWGKVMREVSAWNENGKFMKVESLYAHMDEMLVKKGDFVKKGQAIGTIGNAGGIYLAHLHFEVRNSPGLELGAGYSSDTTGYYNPTLFIKQHRKISSQ